MARVRSRKAGASKVFRQAGTLVRELKPLLPPNLSRIQSRRSGDGVAKRRFAQGCPPRQNSRRPNQDTSRRAVPGSPLAGSKATASVQLFHAGCLGGHRSLGACLAQPWRFIAPLVGMVGPADGALSATRVWV